MLSDAALAADLLAIFRDMNTRVMTDEEYANRFATAVNDSVRRGTVQVSGVELGVGSVTGSVT